MAIGASKLTEGKVKIIKGLLEEGNYTHKSIAEMFDVSRSLITQISNGNKWNEDNKEYVKKSNDFRQFTEKQKNRTLEKVILQYSDGTELVLR